ncbi:MAG TPA: hypothetical protein IAB01_06125 [Candidatus Avidesulfovibrio excrementigallinarum]|nr:hypothetical protein [Candidatus Avidesulfovibrio excrementigallinarum]
MDFVSMFRLLETEFHDIAVKADPLRAFSRQLQTSLTGAARAMPDMPPPKL